MKRTKNIFIAALLLFSLVVGCGKSDTSTVIEGADSSDQVQSSDISQESSSDSNSETTTSSSSNSSEEVENPEIFSYLQGIKSYEKGLDWTGSWCEIEAGGQQFSAFGCGVCCIANMYSTMTGEAHDPEEMYDYSIENSSYNPDSGVGAISWGQLKEVLDSLGIPNELTTKPATLDEFAEMAENHETLLVLVSSYNDETLWKNIPGHYVNIWDYDEADNTVFLTDSKGPHNNRSRVSLEDVYNALKTSSDYQIALCDW